NLQFYVQAVSDTGNVMLTASSPGYQDTQVQIRLTKPSVVLQPATIGVLTPVSAPVNFQARLASANDNSFTPPQLRPGAAAVIVPVSLSDPKIGTLTPGQLTFVPGSGTQSFSFQATAPGTALLTLGVPAGFADPSPSARQQLLNVIPVNVNLTGSLSVGKDLVQSSAIALPSQLGQGVTFTVTSSNPAMALVSNTAAGAGAASIILPVAQNSSASTTFYIHGLASTGPVSLQVSSAQTG